MGSLPLVAVILLVAFTPLAFGTVYLWAKVVLALAGLFALTCWLLQALPKGQIIIAKTPFNLPILLFIALVVFQLVPLPPRAIKALSPNTYAFYKEGLPGWPEGRPFHEQDLILTRLSQAPVKVEDVVPSTGFFENWRPLSLYPYATKSELAWILPVAAIFFVTVNSFGKREANAVLNAIVITGFIVALLGVLQSLAWEGKLLWVKQATPGAGPFGPYMNRNHFAGYLAMTIPLALGLLFARFASTRLRQITNWRRRLPLLLEEAGKSWLLMFMVVIMVTALILSLSRGGITSFLISLWLFFLLLVLMQSERTAGWKRWALLGAALWVVANVIWINWQGVIERLATLRDPASQLQGRLLVWGTALGIFKDFPILGSGLGTFSHMSPAYQNAQLGGLALYAENDHFQILSETGIVGFGIVVLGFIGFARMLMGRAWKRISSYSRHLVAGGITGIVALLLHGLVDFNLHIPANAFLFTLSIALVILLSGESTPLRKQIPIRPAYRPLLYGALGAVTLASSILIVKTGLAAIYFNQSKGKKAEVRELLLTKAVKLNPSKSDLHFELADSYSEAVGKNLTENSLVASNTALASIRSYQKAIGLNPVNAYYHLNLGWTYGYAATISPHDPTTSRRLEGIAEMHLGWALELAPFNEYIHYAAGVYYLDRWQSSSKEMRDFTLRILRRAIELDPRYAQLTVKKLLEKTNDPEVVKAVQAN